MATDTNFTFNYATGQLATSPTQIGGQAVDHLRSILKTFKYKPGWTFTLMEASQHQDVFPHQPYITIQMTVADSYHPERQVPVSGGWPVPQGSMNAAQVM